MNQTYTELTRALHKARIESQVADAELKILCDYFEAEVKPKKDAAKQLAKVSVEAKATLVEYAKLAYKTGTLDIDGPVKMNNSTEIVIDQAKALAWARIKMQEAIIEVVDETLLKPLAKRHPEWATITESKKPIVASDLSKFVKEDVKPT